MSKIKYIAHDLRNQSEYGDLVSCTNCDETMLVDIGTDTCPLCGKSGCLTWTDEEKPEWDGTEEELLFI